MGVSLRLLWLVSRSHVPGVLDYKAKGADSEITPTLAQPLTLVGMALSCLSDNSQLSYSHCPSRALPLGPARCLVLYIHPVTQTSKQSCDHPTEDTDPRGQQSPQGLPASRGQCQGGPSLWSWRSYPRPLILSSLCQGFLWASQQSYKQVRSVLATEAQTELAPFFL